MFLSEFRVFSIANLMYIFMRPSVVPLLQVELQVAERREADDLLSFQKNHRTLIHVSATHNLIWRSSEELIFLRKNPWCSLLKSLLVMCLKKAICIFDLRFWRYQQRVGVACCARADGC